MPAIKHSARKTGNLRPQFAYLKEVLQVMSVPMLELEGYEADDIIVYVATKQWSRGLRSASIRRQDALQLISPGPEFF
jgi:DNA polymerase-1